MDPDSAQHQKDFLNSFLNQDAQMSALFPSFLPSPSGDPVSGSRNTDSPTMGSTQSPNSQLTMSLFNNLIQMQGLENSIVQQQVAGSMSAQASSNASNSTPHRGSSAASPSYNPQMLEQIGRAHV